MREADREHTISSMSKNKELRKAADQSRENARGGCAFAFAS
jgi:hypothetical protein